MIIPLKNVPSQTITFYDENVPYRMHLRWNDTEGYFVIHIENGITGTTVVGGTKVLFGNDILYSWRGKEGGLKGTLYLYNTSKKEDRPNWETIEDATLEYLNGTV